MFYEFLFELFNNFLTNSQKMDAIIQITININFYMKMYYEIYIGTLIPQMQFIRKS